MVPAVTLGVLHRVSIEVAIIIALPCPLLLSAIGAYVRWRWQAMKRARHMYDLEPMPVAYQNLVRSTTLRSTTAPQSVNTASAHSGGESHETKGMSQTAIFHDGSETGLLLNNEQ